MGNKILADLSQREYSKIMKILEKEKKIDYKENYRLYLVSPDIMKMLVDLKEEFAKKLKKEGIAPPRKNPYYYVAKLINPKPEDCAVTFSVSEIKRYILVKDKESILKNIDKEFEIWKNKQAKLAKEACEESKDEEFCKKIKKETKERIEEAFLKKEYVKENIDNVEVVWTSYKEAKTYPSVVYKREGKDYYAEHLRKGVPNILQYKSVFDLQRRNNEIEEYLKHSKNLFGFFYYKE